MSTVKRKVLITGAAGNIGSYVAKTFSSTYDLTLFVQKSDHTDHLEGVGTIVFGDVTNLEDMKKACNGIDTVLHLAASPDPSATWSTIHRANIEGTYTTFVAAKSSKCNRIIYASSIHAVSGYKPGRQVRTTDAVNPGDLYGVSKCFGEALARYFGEQEGLSSIAIRIGAFQPVEEAQKESSIGMLEYFVAKDDLMQLIQKCIEKEKVTFEIVHGVSNNRFSKLDLSDTIEKFDYHPEFNTTDEHPILRNLELKNAIANATVHDEGQQSGIREEL